MEELLALLPHPPMMYCTPDEDLETPYIKTALYNIQSGRAGRLETAMREMEWMNIDIGVLPESKLTDGIYTRVSSGYHIRATEAASHNKGGVVLFWRDRPNWLVESERCHGPNVISCKVTTPGRWYLLMGAYISPQKRRMAALSNRLSRHRAAGLAFVPLSLGISMLISHLAP